MPPRNSKTKTYKKYNVKPTSKVSKVNIDSFVNILMSDDVYVNKDHLDFNKFKEDQALSNDPTKVKFKPTDPRYKNSIWFKSKS